MFLRLTITDNTNSKKIQHQIPLKIRISALTHCPCFRILIKETVEGIFCSYNSLNSERRMMENRIRFKSRWIRKVQRIARSVRGLSQRLSNWINGR